MLRLTATDQSITMTTSATGSVDYISDWTDIVNATAVTTAGSGQGNVTTATTTTIIAAPASGSSRAVRSAIISNRHGSTSNTIQLFKTVGAASYAISKPLVILAGETVRLSDEGFCFVGNACELEVTSATTAEQLESNATTGVMQIVGPAAGTTRVVTIPDTNATMARTDSAQTFTGNQTFSGRVLIDSTAEATTTTDGGLQTDSGLSVVKNAVIGGSLVVGPCGRRLLINSSSNLNIPVIGNQASQYVATPIGGSSELVVSSATNTNGYAFLNNADNGRGAFIYFDCVNNIVEIIYQSLSSFVVGTPSPGQIGLSVSNTTNSKLIFTSPSGESRAINGIVFALWN